MKTWAIESMFLPKTTTTLVPTAIQAMTTPGSEKRLKAPAVQKVQVALPFHQVVSTSATYTNAGMKQNLVAQQNPPAVSATSSMSPMFGTVK